MSNTTPVPHPTPLTNQARQLQALSDALLERSAAGPQLSDKHWEISMSVLEDCERKLSIVVTSAQNSYSNMSNSVAELKASVVSCVGKYRQLATLVTDLNARLHAWIISLEAAKLREQKLMTDVGQMRSELEQSRATRRQERAEYDLMMTEFNAMRRHFNSLNSRIAAFNGSTGQEPPHGRNLGSHMT